MQSGIYRITNIVNGKIYIGRSKNLPHRLIQHKKALIRNKHTNSYLQIAWNFYKEENFLFEVIEYLPIEYTYQRELYWIKCHNSLDRESGYNIEEPNVILEKIRDKNKANRKRKTHISEETKKKISDTLKGHKIKPESKEKMSKTWFEKGMKRSKSSIEKQISRQSKVYNFISPSGHQIVIKNLKQFCRDQNLCITSMQKVHRGTYYTTNCYKGWTKI